MLSDVWCWDEKVLPSMWRWRGKIYTLLLDEIEIADDSI